MSLILISSIKRGKRIINPARKLKKVINTTMVKRQGEGVLTSRSLVS